MWKEVRVPRVGDLGDAAATKVRDSGWEGCTVEDLNL